MKFLAKLKNHCAECENAQAADLSLLLLNALCLEEMVACQSLGF